MSSSLIPSEIHMISGCEHVQTSSDVKNVDKKFNKLPDPKGKEGGACTSALLEILYAETKKTKKTYQQVLMELRDSLSENGCSRVPQLSSSRPMNVIRKPFDLSPPTHRGRKRAVMIGINYVGTCSLTSLQLKSCSHSHPSAHCSI
jgi:hypothetical protein